MIPVKNPTNEQIQNNQELKCMFYYLDNVLFKGIINIISNGSNIFESPATVTLHIDKGIKFDFPSTSLHKYGKLGLKNQYYITEATMKFKEVHKELPNGGENHGELHITLNSGEIIIVKA